MYVHGECSSVSTKINKIIAGLLIIVSVEYNVFTVYNLAFLSYYRSHIWQLVQLSLVYIFLYCKKLII